MRCTGRREKKSNLRMLCRILVETGGANVDERKHDGRTALMCKCLRESQYNSKYQRRCAAQNGRTAVVKWLVEKGGADVPPPILLRHAQSGLRTRTGKPRVSSLWNGGRMPRQSGSERNSDSDREHRSDNG
eukprot:3940508-Rhodomonas_salina.7